MYKLLVLISLFTYTLHAKTFPLHTGNVSFDMPKGFHNMSAQHIQIKYPRGKAPSHVLTNDSTESTIVYGLRGKHLPQDEIALTGKAFEDGYKRMVGGFQLQSNKVVNISGQKWVQLEFISNTLDSKVYNIFMITGYQGQMLVFNCNSTLKEFAHYERDFRKTIQSITLK